jgi:hypothetical protein
MKQPRPDRRRTPRELLASIHKKCMVWCWQEKEPQAQRVWPWYYASLAAAADVEPLLEAAPHTKIRRKARRLLPTSHS